ncbi:Uncharacterized conserved protein [Mannheimia haemolytica]|uniref:Uncharacterized conserved protein n=1 Tax=Mannheimia haemolytica TaxID=75985 RepID=A0A378NBR7_MANHA|nr:Uncharacterized conserved protein [Mannheimia haemolytica]
MATNREYLRCRAGGCNLFDIEQLKLENSPDEFEQLFMCEFIDDNQSVFKFTMIQRCLVDSMEIWKDYVSPMAICDRLAIKKCG